MTDCLFNGSLMLLLFVMGFVFGVDTKAVTKLKRVGWRVLVFPFSIAAGSIFGGFVSGILLGLNIVGSMAVAAGFGWYTLAGPLIRQTFGTEWGALGFTVNFLRELLTIVAISFAQLDSINMLL